MACQQAPNALAMTKPRNEVDVGMLARDAADVEVENPSTPQPESDCSLVEQMADLVDQLELGGVGVRGFSLPMPLSRTVRSGHLSRDDPHLEPEAPCANR